MTRPNADEDNGADFEQIWKGSGFSRNPYDPKPLKVSAEDRELFVGRTKEQKQFKIQTAGTEGGIVIVEGPIGVGKTSFVNAMLYDKWNPDHSKKKDVEEGGNRNDGMKKRKPLGKSHDSIQYLPSFETIQLKENLELTDLMLTVLSNCIFSLETIHGQKVSDSDADLRAGKELIANTVRSGFGGVNFSVLGSGIGMEKRDTPLAAPALLLPTIMNTMDRWFDRVVEKFGYRAVLVPLNNLDVLPDKAVISFLNSARDVLLSRRHVWWILIGGPGLFFTLETNARRVSELVTGQPIILEPMSLQEVLSAIRVRIEKFRISKNAESPVSEEATKLLYDVSGGEVRYIFKRLSDVVYEFRTSFPSERKVPLDTAVRSLRLLAERKVESKNLTDRERRILKLMSAERNFRIRDYARFGLTRPQALQRLVSGFISDGLVVRTEKSYKEVYYSTSGDVNFLFQTPA